MKPTEAKGNETSSSSKSARAWVISLSKKTSVASSEGNYEHFYQSTRSCFITVSSSR